MRALLPLLLLAAGCARTDAVPAHPRATGFVVSTVKPAPLAISAEPAAATPADAVFPLPAPPPGADPVEVAIAASICAAAYREDDTTRKKTIGCRSHPPFTTPEQRPDGKLPAFADDDVLKLCAIERVYRGSFVGRGAKQAVVSFGQCKDNDESAFWDSGFPGSAMLVEEIEGGRWKTVAFEDAVNATDCLQARRPDGHDALLCQSNFWAGSAGRKGYFFALDFARVEKPVDRLGQIFGDNLNCFTVDPTTTLPSGLVSFAVTKIALADVDKDGNADLVVDVTRARIAPSATLDAKVRALCMQNPQADEKPLMPPGKKIRLEFPSRGAGYSPSPATKKILEAWDAEAPEGWNGLK
jgi:hypothetical protein